LGAGVTAATDTVSGNGMDSSSSNSTKTHVTWGPLGSVSFGKDFELVRFFGIAPELRVQYYGFSRNDPMISYNPQTAFLLAINVLLLGAYR
jgi:hypothetical protein